MVLFIDKGFSTFTRRDYELLGKHFAVRCFHYTAGIGLGANLMMQIAMLSWLLRNMGWAKAVYVWFADYHSFVPIVLARLLGRRSVLVLGGYDVTYIPEIGYGAFSNPLRAFCARYSITNADFVLPVDESLSDEARKRAGRIKGKVAAVPTGYDGREWYCEGEKGELVLTVGLCDSMERAKLKGIDFLLEVARNMPECAFAAIGVGEEMRRRLKPPANAQLLGRMSSGELRAYYSEAKVYAQLSMYEGLPNVLCEAMLCECVPVGSNVGGIPRAIGNTGLVVKSRQVDEAVSAIQAALGSDHGKLARRRIMQVFPIRRREEALKDAVKSLL